MLKRSAREAIAEAAAVFVSAASAWVAAITVTLGRLQIPASIESGVVDSGFEKLAVGLNCCERRTAGDEAARARLKAGLDRR
jgi:PIN domain nuclease of toxin-antitoxin system